LSDGLKILRDLELFAKPLDIHPKLSDIKLLSINLSLHPFSTISNLVKRVMNLNHLRLESRDDVLVHLGLFAQDLFKIEVTLQLSLESKLELLLGSFG
jgi:hypothetical protein